MSNILILQGRLTKDPEMTYSQSGIAITDINLAVTKKFKKEGGATADFFSIKVFGKPGEAVANYTAKGSSVLVVARIENNNYKNQEGKMVYQNQIIASEVTFLDSKQKSEQTNDAKNESGASGGDFEEQEIPF